MGIEDDLIAEIKLLINVGNLNEIQCRWDEYTHDIDFGRDLAWDYIFQKVYLHAALKKQQAICDWLQTIFGLLSPIEQIALRQVFPYARHLMNKK